MTGMMSPKHLYTDGDLAQILRALAFTAVASSSLSQQDATYRLGYAAAIAAMATAVGVPPEALQLPEVRRPELRR